MAFSGQFPDRDNSRRQPKDAQQSEAAGRPLRLAPAASRASSAVGVQGSGYDFGQEMRRRIHQKLTPARASARLRKIAVSYHWNGQYRFAGW